MTYERAKEIAEYIRRSRFWSKVGPELSEEEDKEIKSFWETLPGHTTYYDAVLRLIKRLEKKD